MPKKALFGLTRIGPTFSALIVAGLLIPAGAGAVDGRLAPAAHSSDRVPAVDAARTETFIVQSVSVESAMRVVRAVDGEVLNTLPIIKAVGARLTPEAVTQLAEVAGVRVIENHSVTANGLLGRVSQSVGIDLGNTVEGLGGLTNVGETVDTLTPDRPPNIAFTRVMRADEAHARGVTGQGVTVAVLDSGFKGIDALAHDTRGIYRVRKAYDAIDRTEWQFHEDPLGHGTHVTSVIMNSARSEADEPAGVAPDASLVFVKAFDENGSGTYLDVIAGLDWILEQRDRYDIRVLNLSFSAPPHSHYWDDPINQAVMRLWEAGVTVVASAGNTGPEAMTVGVPGNNPYVITAGAMSDNYTAAREDDVLASFSSAGPTHEGFVKPEIVAPGGHVTGLMSRHSASIAQRYPEFQINDNYFAMSGTSQAAAVVSGLVALMLEAKPTLTPDDIKCQLMQSAQPALADEQRLAYSIFQQGAGMVDAVAALDANRVGCANVGLDIAADIAGTAHFAGPASQDADGNFYIVGADGFLWNNAFLWSNGFLWSNAMMESNAFLWNNAFLWSNAFLWNNAFLWSNSEAWTSGFLWNNSNLDASVNHWVDQE